MAGMKRGHLLFPSLLQSSKRCSFFAFARRSSIPTHSSIQSKTMSSTSPPMYTDTPLTVLSTPKFQTGKTDPFTLEASKMAISHNAFIRGFNNIYQQAPRIPSVYKPDFIAYCLAWHECVEAHHQYEERWFFPNVNKAAGRADLMEDAVHEHALFHDGLSRFQTYLQQSPTSFSAAELINIMDSFKDTLYSHLAAEPPMIVELAKYHTPERPIDILKIADEAARSSITLGLMLNVIPIFYLNMNTAEFEGGMWHGVFPAFGGASRWLMTKAVPSWHAGWWRFSSCSPDGRYKQLAV